MNAKICRKCGISKSLDEFYKHKEMLDGHLNICKECKKAYQKFKERENRTDPSFIQKERARGRNKYYRLNYRYKKPPSRSRKEAINKWLSKHPERYEAAKAACHLKRKEGFNLHHWSYNEAHFLEVIELKVADHYRLHRYLKYDSYNKMYRTVDGILLDTREKHENYTNSILAI